ncbi:hypothetical protein BC940DRAFT_371596 [Gongronella butleri]|nr:hypothetical protein BC940DRAFT_371596 [Gongronella butleri]
MNSVVSVSIATIDYYLREPGPFDSPQCPFSQEPLPRVPVMRIFGSTRSGQKTCVHVHQVYPYLFVPFKPSSASVMEQQREIYQFGDSLNKAVHISYDRVGPGANRYIAAIVLTKGVPFYGMHVGHQTFLKIYYINPADRHRIVEILTKGAIMNATFQPHEAHLSFELQFLLDYNLFGMDWLQLYAHAQPALPSGRPLDLGTQFREPLLQEAKSISFLSSFGTSGPFVASDDNASPQHTRFPRYTASTVPVHWLSTEDRDSFCELEIDTTAMMILNRLGVRERDLHHSLHSDASSSSSSPTAASQLVPSLGAIWDDENRRRRDRGCSSMQASATFSSMVDHQRPTTTKWTTEDTLRDILATMIVENEEKDTEKGAKNGIPEENNEIMTTHQSIEALYPSGYATLVPRMRTAAAAHVPAKSSGVSSHPSSSNHDKPLDLSAMAMASAPAATNASTLLPQPPAQPMPASQPALELTDSQSSSDLIDRHYQNILATPSRFKDMTRSTAVDHSIMHTLIHSQSFAMDDENESGNDSDASNDGIPRIPSPPSALSSSALSQDPRRPGLTKKKSPTSWSERVSATPTRHYSDEDHFNTDIDEFLEDDDFLAWLDSSQRGAGDAQHAGSQPNRAEPAVHINYDENDEIVTNKQPATSLSKRPAQFIDALDEPTASPLQISDTPPAPQRNRKKPRLKRKIPQNDGADDASDDDGENGDEKGEIDAVRDANTLRSNHGLLPEHGGKDAEGQSFVYAREPPVIAQDDAHAHIAYQEPYFGVDNDVPPVPKVFSGKEFALVSKSARHLKPFDVRPLGGMHFSTICSNLPEPPGIDVWAPADSPPSYKQVQEWQRDKKKKARTATKIDSPTAKNTYNFKYSLSKPKQRTSRIRNHLDLFSLEVHVHSRGNLLPDPEHDEVKVIFWCLQTEDECIPGNSSDGSYRVGVICTREFNVSRIGIANVDVEYADDEAGMLWALVDKVRLYDPDILVGYELHNASWGYLIERAMIHNMILTNDLARIGRDLPQMAHDRWGYRKASVFRVVGRHMLNVWRLMRSELDLTSYRFENIVFNTLHHRVPHYSFETLTKWSTASAAILQHRVFKYYLDRVQMNLDILDTSDVISKIVEESRVFGIDFYSAITRGSQFKVESVMLRIAKPENFVILSPTRKQVGSQRAIECLPLILEPQSQFYSSPLLVLDFQSLYPSVMIAYNYCYSTCLGRIRPPGQSDKFGVTNLTLPPGLLSKLQDKINVSPNGVAYVQPSVRKSLLARMLTEILETRVMIKTAMKDYKQDAGLIRLLNARQLSLKYIANVTYGYTAASFSGRMPNVEISDSIVQSGREILQKTIQTINGHAQWGGHVVYGDTDSVFVSLPGKSRADAFDIGANIAETITKMFPAPIKLKFEKVYHPCLLLTKKRYVGFKYEHIDETEPVFDAKGIETVRRDGTPATQKIMEACIKILFRTQDLSEVKRYLYDQWTKILANRVSIQDFIIAKEVRLGTYKNLPHGAQLAHAAMAKDPRAEPQYGERVPYVVVHQGPNARLKDRIMKPEALLQDRTLRLDGEYYIRKQIIAPLERVFQLMGADIRSWYEEMPRSQKALALSLAQTRDVQGHTVNRIDQYYASSHCLVCRQLAGKPLCDTCMAQPSASILTIVSRQRAAEQRMSSIMHLCEHCSDVNVPEIANDADTVGTTGWVDMPCNSLDCPVYYERQKACHDLIGAITYNDLIDDLSQPGNTPNAPE